MLTKQGGASSSLLIAIDTCRLAVDQHRPSFSHIMEYCFSQRDDTQRVLFLLDADCRVSICFLL